MEAELGSSRKRYWFCMTIVNLIHEKRFPFSLSRFPFVIHILFRFLTKCRGGNEHVFGCMCVNVCKLQAFVLISTEYMAFDKLFVRSLSFGPKWLIRFTCDLWSYEGERGFSFPFFSLGAVIVSSFSGPFKLIILTRSRRAIRVSAILVPFLDLTVISCAMMSPVYSLLGVPYWRYLSPPWWRRRLRALILPCGMLSAPQLVSGPELLTKS